MCDWQWVGWGLGAVDVTYLLYSSVEPAVVQQHKAALLQHYYQHLQAALAPSDAQR